jgi:hypothetical protein
MIIFPLAESVTERDRKLLFEAKFCSDWKSRVSRQFSLLFLDKFHAVCLSSFIKQRHFSSGLPVSFFSGRRVVAKTFDFFFFDLARIVFWGLTF